MPAPRTLSPEHSCGGHRGQDPWQPGYGGARSGPTGSSDLDGANPRGHYAGPGDADADLAASRAATHGTIPLLLPRSLGSVGYKDRPMFDDKLTMDADFKFDGVSHGSAWKTKIERYMVYKAPVLKELLE